MTIEQHNKGVIAIGFMIFFYCLVHLVLYPFQHDPSDLVRLLIAVSGFVIGWMIQR